MNYFAHGVAYIEQPIFLAGTALPDWLNAVDRKIRVRAGDVRPFMEESGSPTAQFAAGIVKHLEDDAWFHATAGFAQVTAEMTQSFRGHLANVEENPRAKFLGHVTTELLLDGVLIAKEPARLEAYYASLAQVQPRWIEDAVAQFAGRAVPGLACFVERFLESRFLFDYLEAPKLLDRLNQVVRRIKLRPLPLSTTEVITAGRSIVERQLPDLLPERLFPLIRQLEDHHP